MFSNSENNSNSFYHDYFGDDDYYLISIDRTPYVVYSTPVSFIHDNQTNFQSNFDKSIDKVKNKIFEK